MKVLVIVSFLLTFMLIPQVLVQALIWDFENKAQLEDWTVVNGEWTIEDGKLKGVLGEDYIGIIAGDVEWEDYTLEVETTVEEGKYTYWMVRLQDDPESYYAFERNDSGTAVIWRRDAGTHTKIGQDVPLPDDHLESHIWKIEVSGDTITAYVDGEELLSAEDQTYEKGRIGLGGHSLGSATGKNVLLFDYVEVNGPGIPANVVKPIAKLAVTWSSLKAGY